VCNRRLDIIYQLHGVQFEWDEEKARSNLAAHGVTLEEAAEVFFDPFYQEGDASTELGSVSGGGAIMLPPGSSTSPAIYHVRPMT
jgi:hypothetical protein